MRAVLFDFDFTLGDSSKGILECLRYALETSGLPVPDEKTILSTIGMSMRETFPILAPGADYERLMELFVQKGDEVMVSSARLYDGAPEILRHLRDEGYRIGIVSTKFRYRIESILERDGLSDLVDVVIGFEDVEHPKPHPESIEKALAGLDVSRDSAIYVGDSLIDAQAASLAGVKFLAVTTGTTSAEELSRNGAHAVLPDLRGLLDHLAT